jgi:hypothetical protein
VDNCRYIKVKVITRAKRPEIIEVAKDELKLKLVSPPTKNRANRELISLLAKYYKVNKSSIKIKRGTHTREKLIEVRCPF